MNAWGPVPPLNVLVLDWGEEIDTVEFNRRLRPRADLGTRTREAFELLREAVWRQDPDMLGRAATMSALANQHLLFKPRLQDVLRWASETGALGVCVAHSGGLIGVLLRDGAVERQYEYLLKRLSDHSCHLEHRLHRLIPAGPRIATSAQRVTVRR
jgi:L-threonine kinase